ncbi:hypothetical protein LEP1GSC058_0543 [Leptospira fainei serovar Hurstbridge str. BUT 6]|uniref:Uncharacterized protein n=1 Tax=Leptospira fainei serovar Hurstbridge str. BUT 6 TaxID=1193011 RepID=S3UZF8_9LEPT|nr:hypothetical protein LEP1GSC058_0543 [Leptospira fainei serovar Hurstbridge str. BUT 6]
MGKIILSGDSFSTSLGSFRQFGSIFRFKNGDFLEILYKKIVVKNL